ncbi:uncharacterized protein LOC131673328 [Phymastichus coffea]|uniref:uncharacterized protein LOC131673328 n=1 Tax=Phymastichus coffea TaxID=108790 RepID=UPI00273B23EC|nr:uncharacterized protein LOC131673328 [Phymastichus coffea]
MSDECWSCHAPMISIGREEVVLDSGNWRSSTGSKSHGFHLVRSKWDPYPWISSVESASSAHASGLRPGDCLLEVDGRDVLGLEMKDIAYLIGKADRVSLSVWRRPSRGPRRGAEDDIEANDLRDDRDGTLLEGPLPEVARKLVKAVSGVVKALECPVCLESAAPPVSQCVHGHLLCFGCRLKTERCPVCRVRLGQGRCLLADKSHRALTEALLDPPPPSVIARSCEDNGDETAGASRSLHDSIFGPSPQPKKHKSPISPSKAKHLFSKILSSSAGGACSSRLDDRNVSTESLPTAAITSMDGNLLYGRRWLLRLYDRRKSASTGELHKGNETPDTGSYTELREQGAADSGSLLSVPQTPVWGGSTESMTNSRVYCPLRSCRELLNCNTLMAHLSQQHNGPLIHFYRKKIVLPFPLPFGVEATYVLHEKDEIFLLQNEDDKVWMSNAHANCGTSWEWLLQATSDDGVELHLRKEVASLRETCELEQHNVATIPPNFTGKHVTISLIELVAEGCVKI